MVINTLVTEFTVRKQGCVKFLILEKREQNSM